MFCGSMANTPYTVALVVDPASGAALLPLADRLHAWIVNADAADMGLLCIEH